MSLDSQNSMGFLWFLDAFSYGHGKIKLLEICYTIIYKPACHASHGQMEPPN